MIKIQIQQIAKKHGLTNAYALQKALKCSPTMASRLWKEDFKQISLETLQKLCDLFQCQLPYLLIITPNNQPEVVKRDVIIIKPEKSVKEPVVVNTDVSDNEKLLTTYDIAERLDVNRRTVNDYIVHGQLKATKGKRGRNFVKESDLLEFMSKRG